MSTGSNPLHECSVCRAFFCIFTCGEAISDERRRSTSRFFPPSPSPIIKFWHIMPILGCTRTTQEYLVTSREIWLPGKFDFPEIWLPGKFDSQEKCDQGNVTFQKMWLPGKCDVPEIVASREIGFSGKCDLPVNVTSREIWPAGKCDFLGNFSTCEMLVPEKCELTGNLTFQ